VRHIPGPFLSRATPFPLYWASFTASRSQYAHRLLKKYGPIVVIAPNQVHTNDENAMKVIYDRSSRKTHFYDDMGTYKGIRQILGHLEYTSAASARNNLLQCFQNKNLASLADVMESHVNTLTRLLHEQAKQTEEPIDCIFWFRLLTLDTVTDILWGDKTDLLSQATGMGSDFLRKFHAFSKYGAMRAFIPGFETYVNWFGTTKYKTLRDDCYDLDSFAREALQKWNAGEVDKHDRDVLSMLLAMRCTQDTSDHIPNEHLPAYMVEMMAAGSSTTSNTATVACWAVARDQEVQKKLRQELLFAFPNPDMIDMKQSLSLKYLECIVLETMRVWPVVPGPLERYLAHPITVNNHTIPAGIIASTAAYDQGHREDIFPDPEDFKPDRWLNATDRMKQNWIPFGYGSRACPGQNLGMTELKYFLGAIFRQFKCAIPAGHENDQLEMQDVFTASVVMSTGHGDEKINQCWLKFVPSPYEA
jgi:cytochrome P450